MPEKAKSSIVIFIILILVSLSFAGTAFFLLQKEKTKNLSLQEELDSLGFSSEGAKEVVAEILYKKTAKDNDRLKAADMVFDVHGRQRTNQSSESGGRTPRVLVESATATSLTSALDRCPIATSTASNESWKCSIKTGTFDCSSRSRTHTCVGGQVVSTLALITSAPVLQIASASRYPDSLVSRHGSCSPIEYVSFMFTRSNHALQRTRRGRSCFISCPHPAGSLSLGRWDT